MSARFLAVIRAYLSKEKKVGKRYPQENCTMHGRKKMHREWPHFVLQPQTSAVWRSQLS